jgi:predicted negative regulator of RcsB-dependent stress response
MTTVGAGILIKLVFIIIIGLGVLIAYKSFQGKRDHARKCREYERNKK